MKKIITIFTVCAVLLCLISNFGIYLFIKYLFSDEIERKINYLPEKLLIKEKDFEAEKLFVMGFKLKFPFYKQDISTTTPLIINNQLNDITIKLSNIEEIAFINFNSIIDRYDYSKVHFIKRTLRSTILQEDSLHESIKSSYHARLKDFSWWNLISNIRLVNHLKLKALYLSQYDEFNIFDVETPYLNGVLFQGYAVIDGIKSERATIDFGFSWKNKRYSITFIGVDKDEFENIRNIVSTVQPISDIEASFNMMKSIYDNKESALYPEELILISLISLKQSSLNYLERLLSVMEGKNNQDYIIDGLKEAIQNLKDNNLMERNANQQTSF